MFKKSNMFLILSLALVGVMMFSLVPQGHAALTYKMTVSYDVVGGGDPNPPTLHYVDLFMRDRTHTLTSKPCTLTMWMNTKWSITPGNVLDNSGSERYYSGNTTWSGVTPTWGGSDTFVWVYAHQVKVSFDASSQVKKDTTAPVVYVDKEKITGAMLPYTTDWINCGSSISYYFESPIESATSSNTQYVWNGTSGLDNQRSNIIEVQTPGSSTAKYRCQSQYEVNFAADPKEAGTVEPSGTILYDNEAKIPIRAYSKEGYGFKLWTTTGDITITEPTSSNTSATIKGSGTITATFEPISVSKTEITIHCTPDTVDKTGANTTNITGKLTSNGLSVAEKTIALSYFDGFEWIQFTTVQTGPDGVYVFVCDVPEEIENGLYAMKAEFTGDAYYTGSMAATGTSGNGAHLLVVPEYYFGPLAAVVACFAALFVFKNKSSLNPLGKKR